VSSPSLRLLIAASGTGGHVFPALAIAEQMPDVAIEWLGVPRRMEAQLLGDRYPLHLIEVGGFQGKPGLGTLKTAWRLLSSVFTVRKLLKQGGFHGVLTTGGYISGPAIVAARSLGLPVLLHESNALPGKVSRWVGPFCSQVVVGFDGAKRFLPPTTIALGTPVRRAFIEALEQPLDLPIPEGVPLVTIVGGSQGAVAVNQVVRQAVGDWLDAGAWVVHQTGDRDADRGSIQHPHYIEIPFYDKMAALFRRSDLVIGRAGASTLTELAFTGTPSILIPYPFAADDHQTHNARIFVQADAALLIPQAELTADRLGREVRDLLADRQAHPGQSRLDQMAQRAESLAVQDSAQRVADRVRQLIGGAK
jgi:UDP-N-acetylglucosamine--N-acetylmuramyl-(pentapeptide) pyrophosphoryl-undecaprenol N-acetylglucosamine transferase